MGHLGGGADHRGSRRAGEHARGRAIRLAPWRDRRVERPNSRAARRRDSGSKIGRLDLSIGQRPRTTTRGNGPSPLSPAGTQHAQMTNSLGGHLVMKHSFAAAAVAAILILAPATARAQITQVGTSSGSDSRSTVNFSIGYFMLKGLESRVEGDVLLNNLQSAEPMLFEVNDFNSATFGGEYLLGIGERFEAGVGLGYSQRTVHSIFRDLTHADQTEIQQDLKLKQVPITFTGRFLLLPRGAAVEPYVGAGVVAIRYQYSEVGEFIDETFTIFPARFVKDGTAAGPTIFGGVRAPIGNWTVGGELRWQKVEAHGFPLDLFTGDKLDLGGLHANFTFGVRF